MIDRVFCSQFVDLIRCVYSLLTVRYQDDVFVCQCDKAHSVLCLKSHREQFIFYDKNEQSEKSLTNSNHDIEWPTLENPFSLSLFFFSLTLPTRYLAGYCHSFLCSRIRGRRRWKKGSFKWRQILQFRTVTLFDSLLVRMFLLADVCVSVCVCVAGI